MFFQTKFRSNQERKQFYKGVRALAQALVASDPYLYGSTFADLSESHLNAILIKGDRAVENAKCKDAETVLMNYDCSNKDKIRDFIFSKDPHARINLQPVSQFGGESLSISKDNIAMVSALILQDLDSGDPGIIGRYFDAVGSPSDIYACGLTRYRHILVDRIKQKGYLEHQRPAKGLMHSIQVPDSESESADSNSGTETTRAPNVERFAIAIDRIHRRTEQIDNE